MIQKPHLRQNSLPRRVIRLEGEIACVWFAHCAGFYTKPCLFILSSFLSLTYIHIHMTFHHELTHDLLAAILHHHINKVIIIMLCIYANLSLLQNRHIMHACIIPLIILTRILMQKHSSSKIS